MATVTVRVTDSSGNTTTATDTYSVSTPAPDPVPSGSKIVGMSSPKPDWETRLQQVGRTGVTARRIFAQLNSSASNQMDLVQYAHDNDMTPVFSFKVPSIATAVSGGYDTWVSQLAQRLAAFNKLTYVTFHHEPNPDMSGSDFVRINERWSPILRRGQLRFGPFLNGWLLDRQVPLFKSFTSPSLLATGWDFFGIDTYESGTIQSPGSIKPADRMPKLEQFLANEGHPNKRVVIGEYNGYSAATIEAAGKAFLNSPNVDCFCMWNATTGKGHILEGARLEAFKRTKTDPRVRK